MKHEEMRWMAEDTLPLFARKWEPDNDNIKGIICLVHGLGEHSGRYSHWAEKLTGAEYATLAIDLRGHGRSEGHRGYTPSLDHYGDDISLLLDKAEEFYPGKPHFLYGHSLGGTLSAFFLIQRQPRINGAVITSPCLHTVLDRQKHKIAMARFFDLFFPSLSLASNLEQKDLSRDPAVISAYQNDPLVHDRVSARLGKGIIDAVNYIFNRATDITLPLLIMHGTEDRITFPSGSEKLAGLVSGECTLKLWDGLYHELHNEIEKDEVFAFLIKWLENRS
ncbi:MAG: alpha/beta hydrolase [Bacillota bacterium]